MRQFMNITKALSDENRVRALLFLRHGEMCVCQIIEMLQLAPSTVSKHMALLQQAGLIDSRKDGRWRYYRLADKRPSPAVKGALRWIVGALAKEPQTAADDKRLKRVLKCDLEKLCELYRG